MTDWVPQKHDVVDLTIAVEGFTWGVIEAVKGAVLRVRVAPKRVVETHSDHVAKRPERYIPGPDGHPDWGAAVKLHVGHVAIPVDEVDRRLVRVTQKGHPQEGQTGRLESSANGKWNVKRVPPDRGWFSPVSADGLEFAEPRWQIHTTDVNAELTWLSLGLHELDEEPPRRQGAR